MAGTLRRSWMYRRVEKEEKREENNWWNHASRIGKHWGKVGSGLTWVGGLRCLGGGGGGDNLVWYEKWPLVCLFYK